MVATDSSGASAAFDEVVFACDAETVLKTLDNPTWWVRVLCAVALVVLWSGAVLGWDNRVRKVHKPLDRPTWWVLRRGAGV